MLVAHLFYFLDGVRLSFLGTLGDAFGRNGLLSCYQVRNPLISEVPRKTCYLSQECLRVPLSILVLQFWAEYVLNERNDAYEIWQRRVDESGFGSESLASTSHPRIIFESGVAGLRVELV